MSVTNDYVALFTSARIQPIFCKFIMLFNSQLAFKNIAFSKFNVIFKYIVVFLIKIYEYFKW